MTHKKLAYLAVAAVVMVGWAVLQSRIARQSAAKPMFGSSPLVQGLPIDKIAKVTIVSRKGQDTTTLTRQEGRFVVADKDNYPVDVSKLNTLLNSCLDIRTTERITADAANHADLGVTDETAQYAVRFYGEDDKLLTGVLISERKSNPDGAYARLAEDNTVYFIQSPPWLSTGAMDYINRSLFQLDKSNIRKVTVLWPQGDYTLTAQDGGAIAIDPMPEGKQYKGTAYQSVFSVLTSLQADDVRAADQAAEKLAFDQRFICAMKDSTVYTVKIARHNDKTYVKISAEFTDKTPVEKERRVESEEELKVKEAKLKAIEAVQKFNERHNGWIYEIPSYKAGDLNKTLDDLLEDKPAPQPEPTPGSDSPQPPSEPNNAAADEV